MVNFTDVRNRGVSETVKNLIKGMPSRTAGVLGRSQGVQLSNIDNMTALTFEDLQKWLTDVTFVGKEDERILRYVGSTVSKDGSRSKWTLGYENAVC